MRSWTKIVIACLLLILPVAGRWVWFHRGWYAPPVIPQLDESQMEVRAPEYAPVLQEVGEKMGRVVIDLGHYNNVEVDDLSPLWDRLAARGARVETYDGFISSLDSELRGAVALVIVAPTLSYEGYEVESILDFVDGGGRVLLVADPTRAIPLPEEEQDTLDLGEVLFPQSAVPAINSVAKPLGAVYFDDYLYNLVDNEGNYRNVKLTTFSENQPLTQGLSSVVFFASHSLRTDGLSLISGDANTLSPLRTGETGLTAAALAADGNVLALGDLTALTAPYHTVEDNDQFLSNIADWLVGGERVWDLRDFPYLFQRPVDLVQVSGEFVDPRLISEVGVLEEVLAEANLTLNLRETTQPDNDVLFVGTFENLELVEGYLDEAGVTITLQKEEEAAPMAEEEEELKNKIEVQGLGTVPLAGSTLFVVDRGADRVVVIALGEDGGAAIAALERLANGDFFGCVDSDDVLVCSTGEEEEGVGLDEERQAPEEEEQAREEAEEGGSPRIGSVVESELALAAGVPWLTELAEEEYDVTSQAGETYTYTVTLSQSRDVIWIYGWCTTTEELLEQNWENITLGFSVNDQDVSLNSFAMLESSLEDQECRLYYALVTDWPQGEHVLITEVTFETELDDGTDIYPIGTHWYKTIVTVGG
jgi:hypothetical protein